MRQRYAFIFENGAEKSANTRIFHPKKSEGTRTFVKYSSNNHPEKCGYPHFRQILSPQKFQTPQFLSYFHPKTIQIRCLLVDFHPKKHGKHHFYKTITKKQKIGKIPTPLRTRSHFAAGTPFLRGTHLPRREHTYVRVPTKLLPLIGALCYELWPLDFGL